jgi:hypothetical protein
LKQLDLVVVVNPRVEKPLAPVVENKDSMPHFFLLKRLAENASNPL